ncbi:hypothetical protein BDV35DRAFT_337444 [Aspergillus flavus]|uniref:Uncharacterized protein n=1 Tax=Aspergillus flavus TaxID=5059 RepID=A0A5N6HDX3_ASPFL|nr:hypothetical protein BDV35DRAFT_337444 [Aspergillus flavus]
MRAPEIAACASQLNQQPRDNGPSLIVGLLSVQFSCFFLLPLFLFHFPFFDFILTYSIC